MAISSRFNDPAPTGPASAGRIVSTPVSRLHWIAFCVALAAAIVLRVIFFQGYSDSDPHAYSALANDLAHGILHIGNYDGPVVFPLRFGVYAPVALLIKVFGLSEMTLAAFPFLASIGTCLLGYALARHFFGPQAGLVSIAILAVLPFDIIAASTLWPDAIAAFWANIGIALLVLDPNRGSSRYLGAFPILAGLCFGISWLSKESVVYLGPFVAIYVLFLRQSGAVAAAWILISVALGGMLVVLGEAASYRALAGDWLFHLHTLETNYVKSATLFFDQSSPVFGWEEGGYVKALAKRLLVSGPAAILKSFSTLPFFAVLALAWAALVKDRRFAVPAVWFLVLALMFNFASSSLTSYRPLPLFERYLYPLLLPSVLLGSGIVGTLLESASKWNLLTERKFWAATLAAFYLMACVRDANALRYRPEQNVRNALAHLQASDIVYTDYRTAAILAFLRNNTFSRSTDTTIPYENLAQADLRAGAYVLINREKLDIISAWYGYNPPAFVNQPPKSWKKVWSERGGSALFRIE